MLLNDSKTEKLSSLPNKVAPKLESKDSVVNKSVSKESQEESGSEYDSEISGQVEEYDSNSY